MFRLNRDRSKSQLTIVSSTVELRGRCRAPSDASPPTPCRWLSDLLLPVAGAASLQTQHVVAAGHNSTDSGSVGSVLDRVRRIDQRLINWEILAIKNLPPAVVWRIKITCPQVQHGSWRSTRHSMSNPLPFSESDILARTVRLGIITDHLRLQTSGGFPVRACFEPYGNEFWRQENAPVMTPAWKATEVVEREPFQATEKTSEIPDIVECRILDCQAEEHNIPGWVYRRFVSLTGRQTSPQSLRRAERHAMDPTLGDQVYESLSRTGYPMHKVHCRVEDETLILSGTVTRYFYAQVALEAAMNVGNGGRIENQIQVLRAPYRDHRDE